MNETYTHRGNTFVLLKKHWRKLLLLLIVFAALSYGLIWLVMVICGLLGFYIVGFNFIRAIKIKWLRKSVKGAFLFLFVFIISINLKLLILDVYHIPSSSMEDALLSNDVIVVNKLAYGPKLPRNPFEISWVNLLFYMNQRASLSKDKNWWLYRRLSGTVKIKQSDILVYQLSRTFCVVKRCVAVAGDTIRILQGEVYVNGAKYPSAPTVRNNYRFHVKNRRRLYAQMDSIGISSSVHPDRDFPGYLKGNFPEREREWLEKNTIVRSIEKVLDTFDRNKGLFAMPLGTFWTLDEMGPIILPKRGMCITLNRFTFDLYKKVLREHEGRVLTEKGGFYYDDCGKRVSEHTFDQDYYFMMGDNRKGSMDSRYMGFVPESNIIGKVQFILLSNHMGVFRWDRFFKDVHGLKKKP